MRRLKLKTKGRRDLEITFACAKTDVYVLTSNRILCGRSGFDISELPRLVKWCNAAIAERGLK